MTVAVLVPYRPDGAERDRNWRYIRAAYAAFHPDWDVIEGNIDVEGFSRTRAILDARRQTNAKTFLVADADVWVDELVQAVEAADVHGWAIPHCMLHRLSEDSTAKVIAGAEWRGLELSQENSQDRRPYRARPTGACFAITSATFDEVPPDPRFRFWGQEDDAWSIALHLLVGKPWRGTEDLVHLWHEPQPRLNRKVGSREGQQLLNRYRAARVSPDRMRALIAEGRESWQSQPV